MVSNVVAFPGCKVPEPEPEPSFEDFRDTQGLAFAEAADDLCLSDEDEFWLKVHALHATLTEWLRDD